MTISLRRLETIKQVGGHLEPWLREGDMRDYLACSAGAPGANAHHASHDRLGSAAVGFFQSHHPSHSQVHGGYPKHVVDQHAQAQKGGIYGNLARWQEAEDCTVVEGKFKSSDIAFIRPGMPAVINLDAYDYSVYGIVNGEVVYVSPDAITEQEAHGNILHYIVHIKINDSNLSRHDMNIEVQSGMSSGIDIRTWTRTVFNYISKRSFILSKKQLSRDKEIYNHKLGSL